MKRLAILLSLCLLALGPSCSFSQAATNDPDQIPKIILDGLHQLGNQKPEEAEKAWFYGAFPDGAPVPSALPDYLAHNDLGLYQSFDVVRVQDLTPRMRILYLALNFEKRPVIVKFDLYHSTNGWILCDHQVGVNEEIFEPVAPANH